MAIKIVQLQFFVAVATSRNLAEAAERVYRTPAALSLSLKQLEEEIGGPLFEGERKNRLSPLGRFVLLEAQRELKHFDQTIESIKAYARAEDGLVRVAAVPSIAITVLPALIKRFHAQHPSVSLDVRDMDSDSVVRAVLQGEVDMGIATVPSSIPDLTQELLLVDAFGVICTPDNPLCQLNRPIRWTDLEGQVFISSGITQAVRAAEFRRIVEASVIVVRNTSSLLAFVEQGLGITLLPERLISSEQAARLRCLPLEDREVMRKISVVTASTMPLNHAAHTFLKALKAGVGQT